MKPVSSTSDGNAARQGHSLGRHRRGAFGVGQYNVDVLFTCRACRRWFHDARLLRGEAVVLDAAVALKVKCALLARPARLQVDVGPVGKGLDVARAGGSCGTC